MPTEDAYSSGHLVLSHFGTCMCSNVETNLSWTFLVSGLLNFEHPSVLLFCFKYPEYTNTYISDREEQVSIASWNTLQTVSWKHSDLIVLNDHDVYMKYTKICETCRYCTGTMLFEYRSVLSRFCLLQNAFLTHWVCRQSCYWTF